MKTEASNMESKEYTLLQLFSIIDGRLSTELENVYNMLSFILGETIYTHQIPGAMQLIRQSNAEWLKNIRTEIQEIKDVYGNDFEVLYKVLESLPDSKRKIYRIIF